MENQMLSLPDGSRIVLRERAVGDSPRNVFRLSADGKILWQIGPNKDERAQSYVEVYFKNTTKLIAYNFNGWEYEVNLDTGEVKEHDFLH